MKISVDDFNDELRPEYKISELKNRVRGKYVGKIEKDASLYHGVGEYRASTNKDLSILYEKIAIEIKTASRQKNKIGEFYHQVIINARALENINALEFCYAIGVPKGYAIEFRKAIKIAKTFEAKGEPITAK